MNHTLNCFNTQLKEPTLKCMGMLMVHDTTIALNHDTTTIMLGVGVNPIFSDGMMMFWFGIFHRFHSQVQCDYINITKYIVFFKTNN